MTKGLISFSERIDDYDIAKEPLGKGGFATVYKARCRKTGIEVAIKMINRRLTEEAGMVERVREEIKIHTRLKHPAIIELYTFFEDSQYVYLVLELAQNGELQRYFKKNNMVMSDVEASRIMRQVVDGLYYLHSQGILHRDLSLSNLLLSHDMHVKIGDFGLAKHAKPETTQKNFTMCGTPNYISPEVASRTSHGPAADIWGLGCMLYTLLVGRPPFDTETVKSTLTKIVMADYTLPSHLSSEAKDLIQKLLKKNPVNRITLPEIMVHPFMTKFVSAPKVFTKPLTKDQRKILQQHQNTNSSSSQDSGMHTMSSDGYSTNRFGDSTKFGSCRSQSEECLTMSEAKPNMQYQSNSKNEYSIGSCYGSLNNNFSLNRQSNSLHREFMKNNQQSNNNMGLDRYDSDASKQTSVPGNKVKTTHSIHQRYCECDDPICKTRRQIYNKPDANEAREVFTRQNPSTGMNKYDFCTNKKQIDPGGILALGKKFTQNAIVSERKKNSGNEANYFGENINIDSCMQETPRIPQNRFRAKDVKPNCLEGKMQHYKQHKHSSEQAISYNNAQPVRGYESEQHMLNVDCNSIGTVPSSSTQGYESHQDQNNYNRDCGMTPGATSSNENFSEDDYPFNERIGVPPLNTIRLQATRHRTKNAILSITATGEVVIEFIKKRGRAKEEKVTDVCRISDDGLRVVLYQPDEGRGVRVSSEPPPLPSSGTDSLFGYETLPDQHCRKYLYAVRFINLVKAKTPKVTFYSKLTKFQLMETGADFEACFYDGSKISKNAVEGIKITIPDHCPYLCPYDQMPNLSNPDMKNMWEHFVECMTQCQRLDSLLSWNNPCGQNFPIVVGRRPPASTDKLDANKENFPRLEHKDLSEFTTPQFGTTSSTVSATRSEPPSSFAVTAGMSNVCHQAARRGHPSHTSSPRSVQVPGIGVATQLLSGEVQVQYNDGAVLTVPPISPGAGIHYAVGGYAAHFRPEDDLPPKLRERLEKISTVIEHLKMAQPAQPTQVTKRRPGLRN